MDKLSAHMLAAGVLARLLEAQLVDWPTLEMVEILGKHAELVPGGLTEEAEAQLRGLLEHALDLLLKVADLRRVHS